jgi:hypothetical protein
MQEDLKKYVSEPSPPQVEKQPQGAAKLKTKECWVVGEDDDAVIIEDTSDDEDEETLQHHFQLWSRFQRVGMPDAPIKESLTNLEEDVPLPPRKPHNTMRKRVVKKLKVSEDTRLEVSTSTSVVGYSSSSLDLRT